VVEVVALVEGEVFVESYVLGERFELVPAAGELELVEGAVVAVGLKVPVPVAAALVPVFAAAGSTAAV
jgi:hypothetical protein